MRDATRGGVATMLNEMAHGAERRRRASTRQRSRCGPEVTGACELLGIDPLYVACEGRLVAVVTATRPTPHSPRCGPTRSAPAPRVIGRVARRPARPGAAEDGFGGTRIVDMLVGDPLPRIC